MIIIRFLIAALLAFVVVTIAAFVYLKWWQALLVVVFMILGTMLGLRLLMKSIGQVIGKAMTKAFELKSNALKGAMVQVHSVEPTDAPPPRLIEQADENGNGEDDEIEDDEPAGISEPARPLVYYRIDFTLTPNPSPGPMTHWDVDDLVVVDVNAPPLRLDLSGKTPDPDPGEGDHFESVQILNDWRLEADDEGKHEGPRRLSVVVGVPPGFRELKFRYYTEQFGRVVLPWAGSAQLS